jgi:hypothetical protein
MQCTSAAHSLSFFIRMSFMQAATGAGAMSVASGAAAYVSNIAMHGNTACRSPDVCLLFN